MAKKLDNHRSSEINHVPIQQPTKLTTPSTNEPLVLTKIGVEQPRTPKLGITSPEISRRNRGYQENDGNQLHHSNGSTTTSFPTNLPSHPARVEHEPNHGSTTSATTTKPDSIISGSRSHNTTLRILRQ
ncbi:hypothetical protein BLOT_012416 [Blomia tropicalis]|nr:hypothetical protein BLOT_012416 [Blomia tropicalis]